MPRISSRSLAVNFASVSLFKTETMLESTSFFGGSFSSLSFLTFSSQSRYWRRYSAALCSFSRSVRLPPELRSLQERIVKNFSRTTGSLTEKRRSFTAVPATPLVVIPDESPRIIRELNGSIVSSKSLPAVPTSPCEEIATIPG